jgi:type VI secretion system Hcp family effector
MKYIFSLFTTIAISLFATAQGGFMLITVNGAKQGLFKAEGMRAGHKDKIEVLGYSASVSNATDAASGQSTGRRQYQPLTVWKAVGPSSPQFFMALAQNESIKKVTIEYYAPDESYSGVVSKAYVIELDNATIVSYKQLFGVPDNPAIKVREMGLYDEIKFTFEKITVTSTRSNITAADQWNTTR